MNHSSSLPSLGKYVEQLVADIEEAIKNLQVPFVGESDGIADWKTRDEDEASAPVRRLPVWTGITEDMLPPSTMLSDEEVHQILLPLTDLLEACNCHVVFQFSVPDRVQYEAIRKNFDQQIKVLEWHHGFFEFCKPGAPFESCVLAEYCQCAFYFELTKDFVDEDLSPEEERARELQTEILYLRNKYGEDWVKYYPYHLDKNYDDPDGNQYDYGIDLDDPDDDDDWWRK